MKKVIRIVSIHYIMLWNVVQRVRVGQKILTNPSWWIPFHASLVTTGMVLSSISVKNK